MAGHKVKMHPLMIARDEFLEIAEATGLLDTDTIKAPKTYSQYLRNRIERAFCAGWDAAKKELLNKISKEL